MAKSMFSYGIAKIGVDLTYFRPSAVLQLTERKPVFVLVSQTEVSTQQIILVKLRQKKDRRELKKVSGSVYTGIKDSVEGRVDVTAIRDSSNNIVLTPVVSLDPGEYIIFTGAMAGWGENSGYDFGVK